MQLRPYRASDLQTLFEVDRQCFPPGVSYSHLELAGFIGGKDSMTWVADACDEIAGFLVAEKEPGRVGHIITIDVVERWRRKSVGTALMDTAEAWARKENLRLVYLETAVNNAGAQAFYASRGYKKMREIENYYQNRTNAWVMVKRLPEP